MSMAAVSPSHSIKYHQRRERASTAPQRGSREELSVLDVSESVHLELAQAPRREALLAKHQSTRTSVLCGVYSPASTSACATMHVGAKAFRSPHVRTSDRRWQTLRARIIRAKAAASPLLPARAAAAIMQSHAHHHALCANLWRSKTTAVGVHV